MIRSLSAATILKLLAEVFPKDCHLSAEAKDVVVACTNEFVGLISSEATDLCTKAKKKVVAPEHVTGALNSLGFVEIAADVERAAAVWAEEDKAAAQKKKRRRDDRTGGMSEEEVIAEQQRLFAEAAAAVAAQQAGGGASGEAA